nr:twin-arginine translocase TatA/TatE family subunit [Halapricum desulfuricans]
MLGGPEMLGLLLLAVLLFGANKLPKLARSSGQAIGEFQKGREQVEQELEEMKGGESSEASQSEPAPSQSEPETESKTEPQVEPETESSFDDDAEFSNQ